MSFINLSDYLTQQFTLISYSIGVVSLNVAKIIAEDLQKENKKVMIVSHTKEKNKDNITYDDFININKKINYDYLIFSSFNSVKILLSIQTLKHICKKCIILFTWNEKITELEQEDPLILNAGFTNHGKNIVINLNENKLTEVETINYLKHVIKIMPDKDIKLLSQSWINCNVKDGKLKQLMQNLIVNKSRHFIFTGFNCTLSNLEYLKALNIEIVYLNNSMKYSEIMKNINYINENINKELIIVANTNLITYIKNIHYIHMLDSSLDNIYSILDKVYKYSNYITSDIKLEINFYVIEEYMLDTIGELDEYNKIKIELDDKFNEYEKSISLLKSIEIKDDKLKLLI